MGVHCYGEGIRPTAGQPCLSLGVHRVVAELELVPRQHPPPCKPKMSIKVGYVAKRKSS
jgi:hypothetical protein